jgi:hypothetical protein
VYSRKHAQNEVVMTTQTAEIPVPDDTNSSAVPVLAPAYEMTSAPLYSITTSYETASMENMGYGKQAVEESAHIVPLASASSSTESTSSFKDNDLHESKRSDYSDEYEKAQFPPASPDLEEMESVDLHRENPFGPTDSESEDMIL